MNLFLVCLVACLLFFGLMAVGVMMGREPLKGSCGGLNRVMPDREDCPVCGGNPNKCESNQDDGPAALARDAMDKR